MEDDRQIEAETESVVKKNLSLCLSLNLELLVLLNTKSGIDFEELKNNKPGHCTYHNPDKEIFIAHNFLDPP